MNAYLIIDAAQTISLFVMMVIAFSQSFKLLHSKRKLNIVLIISLYAMIQLLYSSFATLIIKDRFMYNRIHKIITDIYIHLESICFLYFYYSSKKISYFLIFTLLSLNIGYIYTEFIFYITDQMNSYNKYLQGAISVTTILCSLIYFIIIISDKRIIDFFKLPEFYLNTAIFFLYSNLIPISIINIVMQNDINQWFLGYTMINSITYIIFYFLLIKYMKWKIILNS